MPWQKHWTGCFFFPCNSRISRTEALRVLFTTCFSIDEVFHEPGDNTRIPEAVSLKRFISLIHFFIRQLGIANLCFYG